MNELKPLFRRLLPVAAAALAPLLLAGCLTPQEQELSPDITLNELEKKMLDARDPRGVFMHAKSYVQKQVVTTGRKEALVEVKYLAPDKYKIVTLKDNQPETAIILNGDSAWAVQYQERRVTPITGWQLSRLKNMYSLGTPDDSYQHLFAQVDLSLVKQDDQEYYKMTCIPRNREDAPISIYVGKNSFLVRRMVIPAPYNYQSTIERYGLYEGVMIPEETVIEQNGVRSTSKIYYTKLNAEVAPDEFLPPIFPPQDEE